MARRDPISLVVFPVRRLLTSVRFAVIQIIVLAVLGVFGMLLPQLPSFALHNANDYVAEMARIHRQLDPAFGPGLVDLLERYGLFRVFSSPIFVAVLVLLTVSIVVCTLDRTPKLWRGVSRVTVEQPEPFFDPRLAGRATFAAPGAGADEVAGVLRSSRFKVRRASSPDGEVSWVYGDRNQYFKMATLLTHLGLVLFLAGGAVTAAFGFETVVFVGEGQTAPVQPVGTPHNLVVKNLDFEAPRDPQDGRFLDFWTDLAVYRDGEQVARKVIRVNDPLEVDGFYFHQNAFGPSADVQIRDGEGRLVWTGPVLLDESILAGEAELPLGVFQVPGSGLALLFVLQRDAAGTPILAVTGLGPQRTDGGSSILFQSLLGVGGTSDPADTAGYAITWERPGAFTAMVIKNDPGAPIIWVAFVCLMAGLALTFYFPRRRVWARITRDGTSLAFIADRYVPAEREFGALLEDLGARVRQRPLRGASPA